MRRRTYIASAVSATLVLAGCNTALPGGDTDTPSSTEPPGTTDEPPREWTATTDCDPMHENVIKAKWVKDDLADAYSPIHFSDLTPGEQEILQVVVEEGGFANCEVTDAFRRFVERFIEHSREQDREYLYLEHEGTYYGLYVQQGDQVFT